DTPTDNQPDLSKNPQFAQLMSVVSQLGKSMQTLQGAVAAQSTNLQKLTESIATGGKPDDKKNDSPAPTDDDVNNMSQAQLAAHIFKGVRGMMDDLGKGLNEKLSNLSTTFES